MNFARVISLLEAVEGMQGRVALAATAQEAFDATRSYPWLWIVAAKGSSGQNRAIPGPLQQHAIEFGVLSVVRDLSDAPGAAASAKIDTLRTGILAALLGEIPQDGYDILLHESDEMAVFRDGILAWIDVFRTAHDIEGGS